LWGEARFYFPFWVDRMRSATMPAQMEAPKHLAAQGQQTQPALHPRGVAANVYRLLVLHFDRADELIFAIFV